MPDGKTPMALTATCAPATRTTIEGNWDWTDGIQVGVMIGDKVKPYTITANYSEADLTSTDPHYWTKAKETVTAWYPYTEGETELPPVTVKDNQFEWNDYLGSDCLAAVEQEVTYGGSTALEFSHRTAKIEITVTNQNGGTDLPHYYEVMEVTISTDGGNGAVNTCPAPAASNLLWNALIPPTTAATNDLVIMVTTGDSYDDNSNDKKYRYKHPEPQTFEANKRYVLTLKVGEHDLVLDGCTIKPWESATDTPETGIIEQKDFFVVDGVYHVKTAKGLQAWAEAVKNTTHTDYNEKDIDCILENDIDMTGVTWEPVKATHPNDNYFRGTFNGNGHTISNLTVNNENKDEQGFIARLNDGAVKNLTLENVNITGKDNIGAVVGESSGKIYCCQVIGGSVTGAFSVGGIAGYASSNIYACSATCSVTGSQNIGGIAGYSNGDIISCWTYCSFGDGIDADAIFGGTTAAVGIKQCYWNAVSGNITDNSFTTKVDGNTVTWASAKDAMNTALKEQRYPYDILYEWTENTDETTKERVPLVLVKK